MWQVTGDMWHVTRDMWHMTGGGSWTFSQNVSSLALTVWELEVTCDTWHLRPDTWHLTWDMWYMTCVKFQGPCSYGLGVKVFWRCIVNCSSERHNVSQVTSWLAQAFYLLLTYRPRTPLLCSCVPSWWASSWSSTTSTTTSMPWPQQMEHIEQYRTVPAPKSSNPII